MIEKLGARKGKMTKMVNHGSGRVRLEFHDSSPRPDRPAQRDADRYARHRDHEFAVPRLHRVAGRNSARGRPARWSPTAPGKTTGYAMFNLQERGEIVRRRPAPKSTKA